MIDGLIHDTDIRKKKEEAMMKVNECTLRYKGEKNVNIKFKKKKKNLFLYLLENIILIRLIIVYTSAFILSISFIHSLLIKVFSILCFFLFFFLPFLGFFFGFVVTKRIELDQIPQFAKKVE